MSHLLQARPEWLRTLKERAEQRCIVFDDEPLPPGASRPTARVGVEIEPATGCARLHVEQGITYVGPSAAVAEWFATGTRVFQDYRRLLEWVAGPLATAYAGQGGGACDNGPADDPAERPLPRPLFVDKNELVGRLAAEVVGQEDCIEDLVAAAALHLARRAPRRPLTALALGPTGVGKTLLAESLADAIAAVSGEPCRYERLDMTEFQERHAVAKLLGAPPGYIGFGCEPRLVSALRSGERVVILIDEIEKAHPEVFLAIMNLMDAGRLTPATGPTLDARHAILLFTTNLGASAVVAALDADPAMGQDPVRRDALVRASLRHHSIAPELVGRLNTLLVFKPLEDEHIDEILRRTIRREAATFGLEISTIDQAVLDGLRTHTPDPGSGVRSWEHLVGAEVGPCCMTAVRESEASTHVMVGRPARLEPVNRS